MNVHLIKLRENPGDDDALDLQQRKASDQYRTWACQARQYLESNSLWGATHCNSDVPGQSAYDDTAARVWLIEQAKRFGDAKFANSIPTARGIWDTLRHQNDYCLLKEGSVDGDTPFPYEQVARFGCCRVCRLIFDGINCLKHKWVFHDVQNESVSVSMKPIPMEYANVRRKFWSISLLEKKIPSVCLELIDFSGM